MTTNKTITVSLADQTADETFQAEYFQIEDGWITFKTDDHRAVVAYPERRVAKIKSEDAPKQAQTFHIKAAAFTGDHARDNAEARRLAAAAVARFPLLP